MIEYTQPEKVCESATIKLMKLVVITLLYFGNLS